MNQTDLKPEDYRTKAREFYAEAAAAKARFVKIALASAAREFEKLAEETEEK